MTRWFRYVPLHAVNDYAAAGWRGHVNALIGTPHGQFAMLMEWKGEKEPPNHDRPDQ